jgi:hypothetical protein
MKLQTVGELFGEASPSVTEENRGRVTVKPSRLTCRWEQDTRGKLACAWTLQPYEEGSVYRAQGTRGMPRPR